MSVYLKGNQSREEIIEKSRDLFNEYGIHLTLAKMAELMGTTLGRVTHHFRNKDMLFIAIAQDYEKKLLELRVSRPSLSGAFDTFIQAASRVMDLQYEYRCAMRYVVASLQHRKEMQSHILDSYSNNLTVIKAMVQNYIDSGTLHTSILENGVFEVFQFQLTNLFTNWVINLELYNHDKTFEEMKPVYLKGIISIFLPYLTEKGRKELNESGILQTGMHSM
jgi:AcrR family transcriptional regulator